VQSNQIPVRIVGPGSQPAEDVELAYFEMPRGMNTFEMPRLPEQAERRALAESRALLAEFLARMRGWQKTVRLPGPRLDLAEVSPAALAITNQVLGEGEVSVRVSGVRDLRIQESVFAGVWRVTYFNSQDMIILDTLEVGAVPEVACAARQDLEDSAERLGEVLRWVEAS
jgi:hydrogenase-1 operon protein HyaF